MLIMIIIIDFKISQLLQLVNTFFKKIFKKYYKYIMHHNDAKKASAEFSLDI